MAGEVHKVRDRRAGTRRVSPLDSGFSKARKTEGYKSADYILVGGSKPRRLKKSPLCKIIVTEVEVAR